MFFIIQFRKKGIDYDKKEIYNIEGMSCASCASSIEKIVGKISGVRNVSVNLATEKMFIESEEDVSTEDIEQTIKNAGYFAKLVDNSEIAENDYNLSVSTYVEKEDTREIIDIKVLNKEIEETVKRIDVLRASINEIVKELENE